VSETARPKMGPVQPQPAATRSPHVARFIRLIRYSIGSVVAAVTSALAFAICFHTGVATTPASLIAFFAGAIPNYILNRKWAWQRTGAVDVWREVVLYGLVSAVSFIAAAAATGWAAHATRNVSDDAEKTILVTGAYVATYAALFLAKFVCFDLVVFKDTKASRPAADSASVSGEAPVPALAATSQAPPGGGNGAGEAQTVEQVPALFGGAGGAHPHGGGSLRGAPAE
jgi:putative flippase GtrA